MANTAVFSAALRSHRNLTAVPLAVASRHRGADGVAFLHQSPLNGFMDADTLRLPHGPPRGYGVGSRVQVYVLDGDTARHGTAVIRSARGLAGHVTYAGQLEPVAGRSAPPTAWADME